MEFKIEELHRTVGIEIEAYVDTNLRGDSVYGWECVGDGSLEDDDGECEDCEGHGYVACNVCDGNNTLDCDDCNTHGEYDCERCDGTGIYGEDEDGDDLECEDCNGHGSVQCSSCDGNGTVECDDCDSDGEVRCGCDNKDSSRYGVEFVSPPLELCDSFENIEEVYRRLGHYDYETDESCGLHIHVGANDIKLDHLRNLLFLMQGVEPLIYALNPNSRYEGSYSKPFNTKFANFIHKHGTERGRDYLSEAMYHGDTSEMRQKYNENRYYGMNLHSYYYRKTIEFRYFEGLKSENMVKYYTELCAKLVEFSKHATFEMLIPIVAQLNSMDSAESLKIMVEDLLQMETDYNTSINRYAYRKAKENIEYVNSRVSGFNQMFLAV